MVDDMVPEPLRRRYIDTFPDKSAALSAALDLLANGDAAGPRSLRDQAHKLAGSAGMYGFDDVGQLAREIVHSMDGGTADAVGAGLTRDLIAILNSASVRFGL